eukprot:366000-Chlamydomonas_euryale.AAC.8
MEHRPGSRRSAPHLHGWQDCRENRLQCVKEDSSSSPNQEEIVAHTTIPFDCIGWEQLANSGIVHKEGREAQTGNLSDER